MNVSRTFFAITLLIVVTGGTTFAQELQPLRQQRILEDDQDPNKKPPVVTSVAISPGGGQMCAVGDDHVVRIWSLENGKLLHRMSGHTGWVRSVIYSPDGRTLASAGKRSDDSTVGSGRRQIAANLRSDWPGRFCDRLSS